MAYSPAIGELALFGGQGTAYDADTWVWTGTTWSQLSTSTSPSVRGRAAMAYDPATSQMVLFGGYNGTSYLADTWQWSAVAVTGVSPTAGPLAGGTSVTITGIGFNGVTAVRCRRPGRHERHSASRPVHLRGAPTVTAVSPDQALLAGGTTVTITGTNFAGVSGVHVRHDRGHELHVRPATSITATSPAESAGTVDVTVTTPAGTSATSGGRPVQLLLEPLLVPGLAGDQPFGALRRC